MKTKGHHSVLCFNKVIFYIKVKSLANILENILRNLSENILKNPNVGKNNNNNKKQTHTQKKKNRKTNSADKLKFLELPPRIVVALHVNLNHKALINVDGNDCPLYFKLISE